MIGSDADLAERSLGANVGTTKQVEELGAVRRCGKGRPVARTRATVAHSPVRIAGAAEKLGILPGLAMDLIACDEHGGPLACDREATRARTKDIIKIKAALVRIASPMR
eukprot:1292489-Pyramimonas_sp.AAC.1